MKLSISNIAWPKEWDLEVYEEMKRLGYSGVEIAPTRILQDNPYDRLDEIKLWKQEIVSSFQISSMQSILYGRGENIFHSEEERIFLFEYLKKAIDFASTISCKNLVFGCPKNRNGVYENRDIACAFFREIGEYAFSKDVRIGMEAVPSTYNTDFLNTTEDTLNFIEDVHSAGIMLNFDVGAMITNEEDLSILEGRYNCISHVHISEPGLKKIQHREVHRELIKKLYEVKYDGFVSIEMGRQNSTQDVTDSLEYLYEIAVK